MVKLKKKKPIKFQVRAKPHTKPKFRSFRSVKINFLGQATIFCTILCLILFFFTYFLSNLAVAEKVIDFLGYVIIISFFAALFFATLNIFYHLYQCIEYVVVHEWLHLIEPKHDEKFLALLDKYLPKWRQTREELNRFILTYEKW